MKRGTSNTETFPTFGSKTNEIIQLYHPRMYSISSVESTRSERFANCTNATNEPDALKKDYWHLAVRLMEKRLPQMIAEHEETTMLPHTILLDSTSSRSLQFPCILSGATTTTALFGRVHQIGDQLVSLLLLLQTCEHHFGAGDVFLGVGQVNVQGVGAPSDACNKKNHHEY
jgi:hypothetical protein